MLRALVCEMKEVSSSQIKRIGYVKDAKLLFIDFGPSVYVYTGIEESRYTELMEADSIGSYFSRQIKSDPSVISVKLPTPLTGDVRL